MVPIGTEAHTIELVHIRLAWALGIVATLVYGMLYIMSPPYEGDAYDYAEIARNLLDSGELIQTHLRFPGPAELELPAPAGRRATLYVLMCLPFQLLFGSSVLVVVLPFLLALLVLPRIALAALGPIFGPFSTLLGSVALIFHPRIFMHLAFDPNVEYSLLCFLFLAFWAFRQRRMVLFGLALGAAASLKPNAAMMGPALVLACFIHDRDLLRRRSTWLGIGLSLCVFAPYAAWLAYLKMTGAVFGEMALLPYITPEVAQGDLQYWFRVPEGPRALADNGLAEWLDVYGRNAKNLFLGTNMILLGWRSGVFETFGILLLPFIPIGLKYIRIPWDRSVLSLFLIIFFGFHFLLPGWGASARVFAPLVAFGAPAAFAGLGHVFSAKISRRLSFSLLILQTLPSLVFILVGHVSHFGPGQARYEELQAMDEVIEADNGPLLTLPFMSFSYYAGGLAVPLPLGSVDDILRLSAQRDAQGMVIARTRAEPCLPFDPALPPTMESQHFCYYAFPTDPETLRGRIGPEIRDFEPLVQQVGDPEGDMAPFHSVPMLVVRSEQWLMGVIGLGVGLLFLWLLARLEGAFLSYGLSTLLCVLLSFGALVLFTGKVGPSDSEPLSFEASKIKKDVPTMQRFRFEAAPLKRDDGTPACEGLAFPKPDGSFLEPLLTCPSPLMHRECTPQSNAFAAGCPPWSALKNTLLPKEAKRLTQSLNLWLDAQENGFRAKGLHTLRLRRMVIAWP
jgi:hypothetical protein